MKYGLASGSTDKNWFASAEGALFYRPAAVCHSFRWAWIARGSIPVKILRRKKYGEQSDLQPPQSP